VFSSTYIGAREILRKKYMRVIVHAEDSTGRGDGYYTKEGVAEALDIFFRAGSVLYHDRDCEEEVSRSDVEEAFERDRETVFYGEDGDKVTITLDWSRVRRED
jgi:hypothetical protein